MGITLLTVTDKNHYRISKNVACKYTALTESADAAVNLFGLDKLVVCL